MVKEIIDMYRDKIIEENKLNSENKAICSSCGEITKQKDGYATATYGFECFDCMIKNGH